MKHFIRIYRTLYNTCKKSNTNFFYVVYREIIYWFLYNKRFWLHQNVKINGVKNIESNGRLTIGLGYVGFIHKTDKTFLNVNGKLRFKGDYSVGRGCRFDIGTNGIVSIGKGGYITANTTFIIMHELTIGDNCAISWDCQFLDEDFHEIFYEGKKNNENAIRIGNNVWVGCGVKIYKGAIIPNNCVIASDSIVKGIFLEENVLIGGNPARIIKENIDWK